MDDDSATAVRCVVGVAEDFDVNVGLHQGFEPMFFAIVMDMMPDDIRQEDPSNYNRANDVAVCPCVRVCVCGNRLLKRLVSPSPKSQVMLASAFS